MTFTTEQRRIIGNAVGARRKAKKLDKEPAARAAKISSITWKRIEDGQAVRDASLAKVLESLGLPPADELVSQQNSDSAPPQSEDDVPDAVRDDEDRLAAEEAVIGDSWSSVVDLAIAAAEGEPSEALRRSTQRIVFLMSGFLIIRILQSGYAPELEPWLQRIYTEREALYRLLSREETPRFPWAVTPWAGHTFANNAAAAEYIRQHFSQKGISDDVEAAPQQNAPAESRKIEEAGDSLSAAAEEAAAALDPKDRTLQ